MVDNNIDVYSRFIDGRDLLMGKVAFKTNLKKEETFAHFCELNKKRGLSFTALSRVPLIREWKLYKRKRGKKFVKPKVYTESMDTFYERFINSYFNKIKEAVLAHGFYRIEKVGVFFLRKIVYSKARAEKIEKNAAFYGIDSRLIDNCRYEMAFNCFQEVRKKGAFKRFVFKSTKTALLDTYYEILKNPNIATRAVELKKIKKIWNTSN